MKIRSYKEQLILDYLLRQADTAVMETVLSRDGSGTAERVLRLACTENVPDAGTDLKEVLKQSLKDKTDAEIEDFYAALGLNDPEIQTRLLDEPTAFRHWDAAHMSDLFWDHLAEYRKNPNGNSMEIIYMAYLWAVHADKALANSFVHAMRWIGIKNLEKERRRWIKGKE